MSDRPESLEALLAAEATAPLAPPIAAVAEAARARFGAAVLAVLFYGSCLRDDDDRERIADLYVLVSDYRAAWGGGVAAVANRLLPPNVFYLEAPFEDRTVRAKVAVMTLGDFEAGAGRWFHSYIWARFAQPSRLGYWQDDAVRARIVAALGAAVRTMLREAPAGAGGPSDARGLWIGALRATYRAELRAERLERTQSMFEADAARYERVTRALAAEAAPIATGTPARWAARRWLGKLLSVLRLLKAAFTFRDGASYLAWKIQRHSGVEVALTPWQRRHPILASPALFWRLYRRGAVQ